MNLLFYAQFKASKIGVDVTATINIYSVNRSSGAVASVVSGGATTHVTNGIRVYQLTNADITTYDYVGAFVTTDATVDDKQPPCLWTKWSDVTTDTSGNASVGTLANNTITANAIATDAITAAKIAADAIGASELATDAVAEIQSGLASQSSVNTVAGYIDTEVAAIKAKTDNLPSDPADASDIAASFSSISSTLSTIAGYIDTEVAAIKAKTDLLTFDGSAVNASVDIEAFVDPVVEGVVAGVSELAGTGTGARTVTITVTDGTDPLEGATLRLTKGALSYVTHSDVEGVAVFHPDEDGTYVYVVAEIGYAGATGGIVVDGDEELTVSLDAITITPQADPERITGYVVMHDAVGVPASGKTLNIRLATPAGGDGAGYERNIVSAQSGVDGLLEQGLERGAVYYMQYGDGLEVRVDTPTEGTSFALPLILGKAS